VRRHDDSPDDPAAGPGDRRRKIPVRGIVLTVAVAAALAAAVLLTKYMMRGGGP
jgi:hypothetical protein